MDIDMTSGDSPPASSSSRHSSVVLIDPPPTTTDSIPVPVPATNKPSSSKPPSSAKPRSTKPKPRTPSPSPPPAPPAPPLQTIRLHIALGGPDNYAVSIADSARATGQRPPTPTRALAGTGVHSDSSDDEAGAASADDKDKDKDKDGDKDKKPKKLKKKKKNPTYEHYDVSDPFIDDSELALDERTFFAQTKQQGFYVSSGEVALLKDKTPKKPKSTKMLGGPLLGGPPGSAIAASSSAAGSVTTAKKAAGVAPGTNKKTPGIKSELSSSSTLLLSGVGSKELPLTLTENGGNSDQDDGPSTNGRSASASANGAYTVGDPRAGEKRKRYVTVVEGGKKRKIVDVRSFHPAIQEAVEGLREAIDKENWDQKGKFPQTLKPLLNNLAVVAIKLDEYDDHFFNLMPTLFPYNKFTMSKLIKRTVFPEHIALLTERQDALLAELAVQADAGFAKAEEEWERSVVAWDKRQEKLRLEGSGGGTGTDSAGPTRHPTEEMDVDTPGGGGGAHPPPTPMPSTAAAADKDGKGEGKDKSSDGKDKDKDKDGKDTTQQPPGKKYRLTEGMKAIVWQLVLLSNECCRLENEKNTLEGSVIQVSEQGLRKALYQKIVAAFPEGWLSSGQISRDVSSMKKKYEKEAMEQENEQDF